MVPNLCKLVSCQIVGSWGNIGHKGMYHNCQPFAGSAGVIMSNANHISGDTPTCRSVGLRAMRGRPSEILKVWPIKDRGIWQEGGSKVDKGHMQ